LEALGLNLGFLISQIVNFVLLLVLLRVFLYKPILKMLDERRQRIAQGMEKAEQADKELARAQEAHAEKVAEAREEAQGIRAEAQAAAEKERTRVLEEARKEALAIQADARAHLDLERQRMLKELRGQVVTLAIAAANKVVGEALDEERQRRLVQEFFSGIEEGRVTILDEAKLVGVTAEKARVTSALPLSEEEQATIRQGLVEQLPGDLPVDFAVDPSILGGLIIRVGDRVVDGSVAGQLSSLRSRLN
jgi:F-type H+-transporting ATPase subunit b